MESAEDNDKKEFIDDFETDDQLLNKRTSHYISMDRVEKLRAEIGAPEKKIGPSKQSTMQDDLSKLKDLMLENLPSSEFYEKSYMHKDIVNLSRICLNVSHCNLKKRTNNDNKRRRKCQVLEESLPSC